MEIIVFDTKSEVVQSLRDGITTPYLSVVQGNGIDATRLAKLDALWLTWMQAERFGVTPAFKPHEAKVFPMSNMDVQRGFPPFIVAGVTLKQTDSRDASNQLSIIVKSMLKAVESFAEQTGIKLSRIGTVPENLLLHRLDLAQAQSIIEEAYTEHTGSQP